MLTGDNAKTAASIAEQVGMEDHRSNLLPADKVTALAELDAALGPAGMVGDGVNDAPRTCRGASEHCSGRYFQWSGNRERGYRAYGRQPRCPALVDPT